MENDYRTARERVSEERLRRMQGGASNGSARVRGTQDAKKCRMESLAMVYSPIQDWRNINDLESGFSQGTIFCELDKPFLGAYRNGGVFNG